jgi:hypothetical protein
MESRLKSLRAGGQLELTRLEIRPCTALKMQYQTVERERKQVQIDPETKTS